MTRVIVALSGGVDSAVTAFLLKKQGVEVVALFMKNWEDQSGKCSSYDDYQDVVAVCNHLSLPYYTISFVEEYKDKVFSLFLKGYQKGDTPNPDLLCNSEIKFNLLLNKAMELGNKLATGHYARLCPSNQKIFLKKGEDLNKDQSYFLASIKKEKLKNVLFPLGNMKKKEVREIALSIGLPNAKKRDSTGICFIGKRRFQKFLEGYIPKKTGLIKTLEGKTLGEHKGAHYYTVGQRKGLDISSTPGPWYVVGKDMLLNIVYVVRGEEHPALFKIHLIAKNINWLVDPKTDYFFCSAKVRYRSKDVFCSVRKMDAENTYFVKFKTPQKAITPGQAIVFYKQDICLGSGVIEVPILPEKLLPPLVSEI